MAQTFGIESSTVHPHTPHRRPARYMVLIESGGAMVAKLFLDNREPAGEFDGASEEVSSMTQGLHAASGVAGGEWDRALAGHSKEERAAARLFTLDV